MKRVWHKGPPPHVGWWNASNTQNGDAWRWWNGIEWSDLVFSIQGCEIAGFMASEADVERLPIEWTDYYPDNARVPRVKP